MTYQVPFMLLTDGYKVDHRRQYPEGTTLVYSNMTPRNGRNADDSGVIFFGLQAAIQKYLVEYANETFFDRPTKEVCAEYEAAMLEYLGPNQIGSEHVARLHELGYLPLEFRAVAEGTFVPYGVPVLTVANTIAEFFWVTNYIETLLSAALWQATTSATTAMKYRVLLEKWADKTGTPMEFIDWQGHDFSFRGMSSVESAEFSGMGHLTAFTGTDTMPAIQMLKHYYDATGLVGGSVSATEHSVMCAGGAMDGVDAETAFYKRLRTKVYPSGILSIVSDTRNLWEVITVTARALKDDILSVDGKTVFRPDSGDPVLIVAGDPDAPEGSNERKGVVELLWEIFGGTVTEQGYKTLDSHVGVIYGDSITLARAEAICARLAEKGFSSANIVFGIGSYTYQYVTRDTHGFAMKATYSVVDGEEHLLYKDPITGDGSKKSARGMLAVVTRGIPRLIDGMSRAEWETIDRDTLEIVWVDGKETKRQTLEDVRIRVRREVAARG